MPGNTRAHVARQAKKRRRIRKIGDLTDARRKMWQAITSAEDVLMDPQTDDQLLLKAVHAMTQAVQAYAKLVEVGELEEQLSELEANMTPYILRRSAVNNIN